MMPAALLLLFAAGAAALGCSNYNSDCYSCVSNILCKYTAQKDLFGNNCISRLNILMQGETDAYNCPRSSNIPYSDDYARNRIWPLIGATKTQPNSDLQTQCITKSDPNAIFVKRINVTCNLGGTLGLEYCTSDLYVLPSLEQIVIVSHGSTGYAQLLGMGVQLYVYIPGVMNSLFDKYNGSVILYAFNAFEAVWDGGLSDELRTVMDTYPYYKVVTTGHSLGGSMAAIIAAQLNLEQRVTPDKIKLITFGQPRTGTLAFVKSLQDSTPDSVRVVNQLDPITDLPKRVLTASVYAQHTFQEVWYESSMAAGSAPQQCAMAEDPSCRASKSGGNADMHAEYFNVHIDSWWESGCHWW